MPEADRGAAAGTDGSPAGMEMLEMQPRPRRARRLLCLLAALTVLAVTALALALYSPPQRGNRTAVVQPADLALAGRLGVGSLTRGRETWMVKGCGGCHGERAEGGGFPGAPALASGPVDCMALHAAVRAPRDPSKGMPPFLPDEVSDAMLGDICTWLASLR